MRTTGGKAIALRPQSFAVLRHLLENEGRVVGKDELMQAVWPDVAVTDDALLQCIHEVRDGIGDGRHVVIKTLQKRGYLLEMPETEADRRVPKWWRPALLAALVLAIGGFYWTQRQPVPATLPLVAVLPIDALSDDESTRLLARGLTDDLITDLARFPEFGVLARNSTERYTDKSADPKTVGSELGVRFMIEGSIARQDAIVRVTAQLIDTTTGDHVWSNRWDRPMAEYFSLQTEISAEIANRLGGGAGLVQAAGRIAAHRKPPGSLNAYELYLLGTERLEQVNVGDLNAASVLLNRAVADDPGLARAWIELFHTHSLLANFGEDPVVNRAKAVAAADKALMLDPGDAEAHAVKAMSLIVQNDFARGREEFHTALRMAPNSAEILTFYVGWASGLGEAQQGADAIELAIRLDPNYRPWANPTFAWGYFMAGRYQEALPFLEVWPKEKHVKSLFAVHAGVLASLGRTDEAKQWVAAGLEAFPGLSIESLVNDPGYTEADLQRLTDVMRLAGFPACADAAFLAGLEKPRQLEECSETPPVRSAN